MVKFNFRSIFVSAEFWRILCEALFALGKLIACIVNDGNDALDDESMVD